MGHDYAMIFCGHTYHIDCVKNYIEQKEACPICKEKVDENKVLD